ncbi:hypothetical protein [uncultured Akkermansia sp.]|uniref:hypothetical protein n=1 Tax=uncultured Akkermansia sp. TaxID=512294 RepID=UPI0025FA2027|nr:hypothetical protein [uncultured Akkermansia sp.]
MSKAATQAGWPETGGFPGKRNRCMQQTLFRHDTACPENETGDGHGRQGRKVSRTRRDCPQVRHVGN